MIGDAAVVDAVVHGFDFTVSQTGAQPGSIHQGLHVGYHPRDPKYRRYLLSRQQYERAFTAAELVSCLFEESQTDIGVYHHVRGMGRKRPLGRSEISSMALGLEAQRLAPGRILLYGALSDPFDLPRCREEIDRYAEERRICGLKFYPHDWNQKKQVLDDFLFDDQEVVFPLLEHAQKRGIRVIAVHKAMGSLLRTFGVADLEGAAKAFPKLNFEIVHAGFAFLEDTVRLACFPNIYLNLEATSGLLGTAPRRFAELLGRFLYTAANEPGAEDRILWATGAVMVHPQPLLELFWQFTMPPDLMEGYGYPELTPAIKRKILGLNFARMHGLDLNAMLANIPADRMRKAQLAGELAQPWSKVPLLA